MRKTLIKWLKGIPQENLVDYQTEELKATHKEIDDLYSELERTKAKVKGLEKILEDIPYKLQEMKISRRLYQAIINKLKRG